MYTATIGHDLSLAIMSLPPSVNDALSRGLLSKFEEPLKDITEEVFTVVGLNQEFEIPPGQSDHVVNCEMPRLPKPGMLLGAAPHMHYRGKAFVMSYDAGNESKTLLEVPSYDFNWQHHYRFEKPIDLEQIDSIKFQMTFDNSDDNPHNPNSGEFVFWGDQTFEEMAVAFVEIAQPIGDRVAPAVNDPDDTGKVDWYFQKFDKNGDGFILRSEVTKVMKHFGFWDYDLDGDDRISRSELLQALEDRR